MINLLELIKTYAHFSRRISRSNLLIWNSLGPFFIILVLGIAFSKAFLGSALFPFVLILSLLLSYRWKLKGFIIAFFIYSGFIFLISEQVPKGEGAWTLFFSLSLLIGFFITALSREEIQGYLSRVWEIKDQKMIELSEKTALLDEKAKENQYLQDLFQKTQDELMENKELCQSLKNLVQVTEKEEKGLRRQTQEVLTVLEEKNRELAEFKTANNQVSQMKEDPHLLDELNKYRVENYQIRILLESYEQELEKYKKIDAEKNRLLFEKKGRGEQFDFLDEKQHATEWHHIMHLTKERDILKKENEQLRIQYQNFNKQSEQQVQKISDIPNSNVDDEVFLLKKEKEENFFEINSTEKFLHDYLSFTDQECIRLEEENEKLKEIIDKLSKG